MLRFLAVTTIPGTVVRSSPVTVAVVMLRTKSMPRTRDHDKSINTTRTVVKILSLTINNTIVTMKMMVMMMVNMMPVICW